MGRIERESQLPYPPPQPQPQPQPEALPACYSYPRQQAVIYPQNVNVVQIPPQYQQNSPMIGSCQTNAAATGMPVQFMPMPSPTPIKAVPRGSWTTGLFDCMEDPSNALVTAVFPCVTFGQIADVLDNGQTTCATSAIIYAAAPCIISRPYRTKLRRRFGLVEAPAADWIIHSMFEPCALCQEFRELNNRGINPALGHHGNLNKQQNSPMMVPPSNQMMR